MSATAVTVNSYRVSSHLQPHVRQLVTATVDLHDHSADLFSQDRDLAI
jgi:hypothetical protein